VRPKRRTSGITLIELLIAMAILGLLMALAYGAVMQGLTVQSSQEAATASQARLRRITEVFTQELRSALLGAVSNEPFTAGSSAVSFTLLDGGAGYQVGSVDAFGSSLDIVAPVTTAGQLGLLGRQAMAVDAGGQAVIFQVSSISASGTNWKVTASRSGCFSGMSTSQGDNRNMLLFAVRTLGVNFDAGEQTLYQQEGSGSVTPLAFDLSDFRIEYVYRNSSTGELHTLGAPLQDGGLPAKFATIGGSPVELHRLQLYLESTTHSSRGDVVRSYQSQVDLSNNESFSIKVVESCV